MHRRTKVTAMEPTRADIVRIAVLGVTFWGIVLAIGTWAWIDQPRVDERADANPSPTSETIYDVRDPVAAGDPTPVNFHQLLSRDDILPIYSPGHVAADDTEWEDETLVIGVALEGEAAAYPVRALNRREIVNDRIGDTPILVSW